MDLEPPCLLGSTNDTYSHCNIVDSWANEKLLQVASVPRTTTHTNQFKTCQWTPDGSSLIASNQDQCVRTFVPPPNLLSSEETEVSELAPPYSRIAFPHAAVSSLAIHPRFEIGQYFGAYICVSTSDHPLQLFNVHDFVSGSTVNQDQVASHPKATASYPLINPDTEAMTGTLALSFGGLEGSTILAGTTRQRGKVCIYDVARPGEMCIASVELGYKSRPIVSTIAPQQNWDDTMTAVAGFYNSVYLGALYDFRTDELAIPIEKYDACGVQKGVTQMLWSSNGRCLFVVERQSSEILVLDARMAFKPLASLKNYHGNTNQRLFATTLLNYKDGLNYLCTGSTDGSVYMYDEIDAVLGAGKEPVFSWRAHEPTSNVSSVSFNPISGTENVPILVSTTGGRRTPIETEEDSLNFPESTLKIWKLK